MSRIRLSVLLALAALALARAAWAEPVRDSPVVARLVASDVAALLPSAETTAVEFRDRLGQFELRVPQGHFPIGAPHCRGLIILRMPSTTSDDSRTSVRELDERWRAFQAFTALRRGELAWVGVLVHGGRYVERGPQGTQVLRYCNAWIVPGTLKTAGHSTGGTGAG